MEIHKLLDQLSEGILRFDSNLNLVFYNKAAEWMVEHIKFDRRGANHPVSLLTSLWLEKLGLVLKTQGTIIFEFKHTESTEINFFEAKVIPDLEDESGKLFINCTIRNVTDHNRLDVHRLQLALEKSRIEMVKSFSINMAHDIRTPLSLINTNSYLLRQLDQNPRQIKYIEKIEMQVVRINQLLDSVLMMTRLDNQTIYPTETIDVSLILDDLCSQFTRQLEQSEINLAREIASGLTMNGCAEDLQIALENVVHNAIHFSNHGGLITVSAYQHDDSIIIQVQDNGIGIKQEHISLIFDHFYRVNDARTPDTMTPGNGLGLAITKAVIERHDGSIEVSSQHNVGTTISITLPVNSVKTVTNGTFDEIPRNILQNFEILVVDDDPDSLEIVKALLERYHASVYTATNGQEALTLLEHFQPRLIISDLAMPVLDGWELVRILHQTKRLKDIPVMALTAFDKEDNRQLTAEAGFTNYLTKPLKASVFIDELLTLLQDIPHLAQYLKT